MIKSEPEVEDGVDGVDVPVKKKALCDLIRTNLRLMETVGLFLTLWKTIHRITANELNLKKGI